MATSKETFKIALGSLVLHHSGVNAPLYEASIHQYVDELEFLIKELEKEIKKLKKMAEEC
jgi:hypothetical protein